MQNVRNVAVMLAIFAGSLGAWEAIVRAFAIPIFILPRPRRCHGALPRIAERRGTSSICNTHCSKRCSASSSARCSGFFLGTAVA